MIHLSVLIIRNYRPVSLAAIMDVFTTVNRFHLMDGKKPPFYIEQLEHGKNGIEVIHTPLQTAYNGLNGGKKLLSNRKKHPELILIPAFNSNDLSVSLNLNREWIPWLQKQYKQGVEIASFCTGAFLSGMAGLLDGKRATTHLMYMDAFRKLFPAVIIYRNAVVTDDSGIYTSGGAISSFHLMLHLINKLCSREACIQIAKMFAIDPDRVSQSYFSEFNPEKEHHDSLVTGLQEMIENNYDDNVSITELADKLPASRRTVYRRFKKATGLTPHKYLQHIRVEAAKRMLEQTNQTIGEIMYQCGYSDSKTFRNLFRETVGLAPKSYRKKFASV